MIFNLSVSDSTAPTELMLGKLITTTHPGGKFINAASKYYFTLNVLQSLILGFEQGLVYIVDSFLVTPRNLFTLFQNV